MSVVTIWLLGGVIGIFLELLLPGLIVLFFGCGAVLTGLAAWVFPSLTLNGQLIVFTASSVVLLLIFRRMLKNKFFYKNNSTETIEEVDAEFVGKIAIALSTFEQGRGKVEFKGTSWEAVSQDSIQEGDLVIINARESITLSVSKQ